MDIEKINIYNELLESRPEFRDNIDALRKNLERQLIVNNVTKIDIPQPSIVTTTQAGTTTEESGECPIPWEPSNYNEPDAGEETNPYEISNANNLQWLSLTPEVWDKHFIQTNDIDAYNIRYCSDDKGWSPIGKNEPEPNYFPFSGVYTGNGFKISNLYMNRADRYDGYLGMFAYTNGATITGLGLENIEFTLSEAVWMLMGGLIARKVDTTVSNCYVTGVITHIGNNGGVGGFSGSSFNGTTDKCFANVEVKARNVYNIGGFIGDCDETISDSYALGDVEGNYAVGGFSGFNWGTINRCYSKGSIEADFSYGGFSGSGNNTYSYCYWDMDASEVSTSAGTGAGKVKGRTTAEMTYPYDETENLTYQGWDFAIIWSHDTDGAVNDGYPYLQGTG